MGNSVTFWIEGLKAGDEMAAQQIWERYCTRLIEIARSRLTRLRRAADEEDVVQEAFEAFFRAAHAGQFTRLNDRDDLWRLLVTITENRAADQRVREIRAKRGGGGVRGDSVFGSLGDGALGFDQLADEEPTPEFAAQVADELRHLLDLLDSPQLQELARLKMMGHTKQEIAQQWGCATLTVTRKLRLIRAIWTEAGVI